VLSCELFWDPFFTNFMKPKSVLSDSTSRTITNAQMMRHVLDTHRSVIKNYGTDAFNAFLRGVCGRASSSFFINENCGTIPEHGYPFVHTLLRGSTVSVLCRNSVVYFCPRYIFIPENSYHYMLFFFGAYGKLSGHVNSATTTNNNTNNNS
jgi:hypothetical protein